MKADDPSILIDDEFRDLIPPLSQDEAAMLEQDILANGIRDPLTFWETEEGPIILLDGHNRFDICARCGLEFETRMLEFETRDQAKAWMIRNQLARRNLTPAARVELARILEPIIAAQNESNQAKTRFGANDAADVNSRPPEAEPKHHRSTDGQVAKLAGVSSQTVHRVRTVAEADPALAADMKAGRVSVNKAYQQVQKKKKKKKKTTAAATPEIPLDDLGNPLMHDHLQAAFGTHRGTLKSMRNTLNEFARDAETLFEAGFNAWLGGAKQQAWKRDINNLKSMMKFMTPYAVCPMCDGEGKQCRPCKGTGWVNKQTYEHIPENMR